MERLNARNAARLRSIIRTFPATLLIEALVLLVACITASGSDARHDLLVTGVGLDLHKVLSVQLWTLPVSTLVQSTPGIGIFLAIFVAGALGLLEYLVGSWRAAVTFFLSDWISAPLTILVAWPLAHLGLDRALSVLYRPDTGSSAAALGALAAALILLPGRWRAVSVALLFTILVCLLPTPGLSANIAHLLGALTGCLLGLFWTSAPDRRHRPSDRLAAMHRPNKASRAERDADGLSHSGVAAQKSRRLSFSHGFRFTPARSRRQTTADSRGYDE